MKAMDFRDRWVLVTGASSGLGRAMAVELVRKHGARIAAVARRGDRLDDLRREIEGLGGQLAPIVADLSQLEEVDRALAEADQGGRLYAAILNAGVAHFGPFQELGWSDFDAMLNTNVRSVVRLVTQLIAALEARGTGGGVMMVSSLAGLTTVPYQTAYSATKAFLISFGAGLWHELRGKDVSVTTYAPGGIATEMTAGARYAPLRSWLMDVDRAAREGVEAFRKRKDLYVPGITYRFGHPLLRVLPQRLVVGSIAAVYRRALEKAALG
jgi:short-subunit dehydrogenase